MKLPKNILKWAAGVVFVTSAGASYYFSDQAEERHIASGLSRYDDIAYKEIPAQKERISWCVADSILENKDPRQECKKTSSNLDALITEGDNIYKSPAYWKAEEEQRDLMNNSYLFGFIALTTVMIYGFYLGVRKQ